MQHLVSLFSHKLRPSKHVLSLSLTLSGYFFIMERYISQHIDNTWEDGRLGKDVTPCSTKKQNNTKKIKNMPMLVLMLRYCV